MQSKWLWADDGDRFTSYVHCRIQSGSKYETKAAVPVQYLIARKRRLVPCGFVARTVVRHTRATHPLLPSAKNFPRDNPCWEKSCQSTEQNVCNDNDENHAQPSTSTLHHRSLRPRKRNIRKYRLAGKRTTTHKRHNARRIEEDSSWPGKAQPFLFANFANLPPFWPCRHQNRTKNKKANLDCLAERPRGVHSTMQKT